MNREIKYRAWDKKNKEMYTLITLQWLETLYIGGIGEFSEVMCEVDDTIALMQYTGLKDKNGKEIYEGDVLQHKTTLGPNGPEVNYHKEVVIWGEGEWLSGKLALNANLFVEGQGDYTEIIGNIYENPELLKA